MFIRRLFNTTHTLKVMLFVLLATLMLYITHQNLHFTRLNNQIRDLNAQIANLKQIDDFKRFVVMPKTGGSSSEASGSSYIKDRMRTTVLTRDYDYSLSNFQKNVVLLVYSDSERSLCLPGQINKIRELLPDIKIIVASQTSVNLPRNSQTTLLDIAMAVTEGKALNKMLSMVNTKYFLYLSDGATVSNFTSNSSPGWLLHALTSIPDLDFVGGGYVRYNASLRFAQYEVQCYRLKMCSWMFSQTYEYRYSIGDMMVCEETSTSFMGRTASVAKVGGFDESLTALTTTEFFWRAKGVANVGLRPEVYFHVSRSCVVAKPTESLRMQAFMYKYDLRKTIDSYGTVTDCPKVPSKSVTTVPVWRAFAHKTDGGMMTPASYDNLLYLLYKIDDFFKDNPNLTYFVDGGVTIGSLKRRSMMPWDGAADIDTGYYGIKWPEILEKLKKYCPSCSFGTGSNSFGPPGLRHIRIDRPHSDSSFDELYTHEFEAPPPPHEMMYIFINGRDIPVPRNFISVNRVYYGINYLKLRTSKGEKIVCKVPGHHACLSHELSEGGGHWKEFYCN